MYNIINWGMYFIKDFVASILIVPVKIELIKINFHSDRKVNFYFFVILAHSLNFKGILMAFKMISKLQNLIRTLKGLIILRHVV